MRLLARRQPAAVPCRKSYFLFCDIDSDSGLILRGSRRKSGIIPASQRSSVKSLPTATIERSLDNHIPFVGRCSSGICAFKRPYNAILFIFPLFLESSLLCPSCSWRRSSTRHDVTHLSSLLHFKADKIHGRVSRKSCRQLFSLVVVAPPFSLFPQRD